jgi:hypothetical protein
MNPEGRERPLQPPEERPERDFGDLVDEAWDRAKYPE